LARIKNTPLPAIHIGSLTPFFQYKYNFMRASSPLFSYSNGLAVTIRAIVSECLQLLGVGEKTADLSGNVAVIAGALLSGKVGGVRSGAAKAGAYSVYKGMDAAHTARYVGITGREPAVRFAEHAASGTAKAGLFYETQECKWGQSS
jgi:hypothetical protein